MHSRNFGLDLLRAVAILGVMLVHSPEPVHGLPHFMRLFFSRGWFGVDLFFVLSGFLIGSQAFGDFSKGVRHFWIKRWTRTVPLYLVVLFTYGVLKPWLFGKPFVGGNWRYLVFLQNTQPLQDFVQSWSLCVEEQFYIVFPLFFLLLRRSHPAVWLLPVVLSLGLRIRYGLGVALDPTFVNGEFDYLIKYRTLTHLDSIAAGVFLAATRSRWGAFPLALKRALGLVGIFVIVGASFLNNVAHEWQGWVIFTVLAFGFSGILIGAFDLPRPRSALAIPVEKIALWSYGIYLWNSLMVRVLDRAPFAALHWSAGLLVFFGSVGAVSWLTYVVIEKPGMALRRLVR